VAAGEENERDVELRIDEEMAIEEELAMEEEVAIEEKLVMQMRLASSKASEVRPSSRSGIFRTLPSNASLIPLLTPHSSLLTPHSHSSRFTLHFPLYSTFTKQSCRDDLGSSNTQKMTALLRRGYITKNLRDLAERNRGGQLDHGKSQGTNPLLTFYLG
jgi:hypothetical protein